jgi:hypothetical protein
MMLQQKQCSSLSPKRCETKMGEVCVRPMLRDRALKPSLVTPDNPNVLL